MPGPRNQIDASGPVLRVQAGQTRPSWWETELTQAGSWARPSPPREMVAFAPGLLGGAGRIVLEEKGELGEGGK